MPFVDTIRKSNVLRRLKPLRAILGQCFRMMLKIATYKRGIKVNLAGRMPLRLDSRFYSSRYENWGRDHNDGFGDLLDLCKNKKTVLDIGAHIGLCALPISRVIAPEGSVYAFEPSACNLSYLQKHLAYNRIANVQTFPYLVGASPQEDVSFYESNEPTGMNALIQYKQLPSATWTSRRQISIDHFCSEHAIVPDIIKIDVEGAEVGVLKGAQKTIQTHHPTIVLSIHPRHLQLLGETEQTLADTIHTLGYAVTDASGQPVETFEFKEYILHPVKSKQSAGV